MRMRSVIFGVFAVCTMAQPSPATIEGYIPTEPVEWIAYHNEEIEFGLTMRTEDVIISEPRAFETGYNGCYSLGNDILMGWGQTFKAPYEGTLESIELRVGDWAQGGTGEFEVALYQVVLDSDTMADYTKLASTFRSAEDYLYDNGGDVPISSFDFHQFDIELRLSETYAFAVLPTSSLDGRISLQSMGDLYHGGNPWQVKVIPEATSLLLLGLGGVMLRKRRQA